MTAQYEVEHPKKAFGWAARDTSGVLSPFNFSRRLSLFYTSFLFFICCTIVSYVLILLFL
jgi:hypothetical protein